MKVTVIPVVIGALGTITKGWVQGLDGLEIRGWMEIIQNSALLRSARILRIVLETCWHSDSSEKLSVSIGVKNSQRVKITIIIIITKKGKP